MAKKYKPIRELTECPYCGCESWFYIQTYKGICELRKNFDGTEAENGDNFDGATYKLKSKYAFCADCHEKIGLLEDGVGDGR